MAGLTKIPELPACKEDGTLFSRKERELHIRTMWKTVHERRLMAIKPYGLSKAEAFSVTPISILHWLLDEMARKSEIEGPIIGVGAGQEVDESALANLIQSGHAEMPQEGEGIDMGNNKAAIPPPPPPPGTIPPSPGTPAGGAWQPNAGTIPPPPGTVFGGAPSPQDTPPLPTKKKRRGRGKSKKIGSTSPQALPGNTSVEDYAPLELRIASLIETQTADLDQKLAETFQIVNALDNTSTVLVTRISELEGELSKIQAGVAVLLRAVYQKQGSADLTDALDELGIKIP